MSAPIVEARDLVKEYAVGRTLLSRGDTLRAVDRVSLSVEPGETLGLVGESGCGKSTLGRTLLRLASVTDGAVLFEGRDITGLGPGALRPLRARMQMVFQDPYASLNPRRSIGDLLAEPFRIHTGLSEREIEGRVEALLRTVEMPPAYARRYPHEFSGGQRQRIGIARAIALEPRLVIADEPVSALDVSIQAQIVNLFADLRERLGLTYVFIAHDLAVVRQISTRIAVMYLGRIVEIGPADAVFESPRHPYTAALLAATPDAYARRRPSRDAARLAELPSPTKRPSGCAYAARCPRAAAVCRAEEPVLARGGGASLAACHFPLDG